MLNYQRVIICFPLFPSSFSAAGGDSHSKSHVSHLKWSETFEVNTKRCHLHGTGLSRFSRVEGFQRERMGTDGNLPSSTYVEHIFTVFTLWEFNIAIEKGHL
jgi:hypothetical protein